MNGIDIDKLYSSGFIQGEIKFTEWYPWHKYKEIANKLLLQVFVAYVYYIIRYGQQIHTM